MAVIDDMLRGGAIALLLLVAGANLRRCGQVVAARLGALLAVGVAAYLVETLPGFRAAAGLWSLPLFVLMAGTSAVFWLTAWALFDDAFDLRPWHAAVWLGVVAVATCNAFLFGPMHLGLADVINRGLDLIDLVFAALAVWQALVSWREDLVERRRRVRAIVVIGGAAFIILHAVAGGDSGTIGSAALLIIAATVAATLLGVEATGQVAVARAPSAAAPEDVLTMARLERLMAEARPYREPRLGIAGVAQQMGLPEYRLRRLINRGLGARNFAAFVNGFRLTEVKAALADPAQAEVPVLTIALDAGFGSLGPFNRAFKADTGMTPTAYRQAALADSKTAGRISKSA